MFDKLSFYVICTESCDDRFIVGKTYHVNDTKGMIDEHGMRGEVTKDFFRRIKLNKIVFKSEYDMFIDWYHKCNWRLYNFILKEDTIETELL